MRANQPQLLTCLFTDPPTSSQDEIQHMQQHLQLLLALKQAVANSLSQPLRPWCRVANYRQGILILEIANASWLMRLRYEQAYLLSTLQEQILPSLSVIDIRINPTLMLPIYNHKKNSAITPQSPSKVLALPPLSAKTVRGLKRLAEHSPKKLRVIVERIAALTEKKVRGTEKIDA